MEIPKFDPSEKAPAPLMPVDRSKERAARDTAAAKAEAVRRLDAAANEVNAAERARRAAEPREAARQAFEKTVNASMERIAKAKSPEDLLVALDGVDVRSLDEVQANALRFRLNQAVPVDNGGRPRTNTEMAIMRKILGKADGNAMILEGAAAEMHGRAADELARAAREDAQAPAPQDLRGVRTVVPGTRRSTEAQADPGVFNRLMRNARKSLGL